MPILFKILLTFAAEIVPNNKFKTIMRSSLSDLIEAAIEVKSFLEIGSFESHVFDDQSYVDLFVSGIDDPVGLCAHSRGLDFKILWCDRGMFVRLYEDFKY